MSNVGGLVEIELFCQENDVSRFLTRLRAEAPPLSAIDRVEVSKRSLQAEESIPSGFGITASSAGACSVMEVPPDAATCRDCLQELFDPADRRYQYPFINCTNCGPRFTIIGSLPYDRSSTTMSCFPMCASCQSEYDDPLNRRFHAQPDACWECGPQLRFVEFGTLESPLPDRETNSTTDSGNPFSTDSGSRYANDNDSHLASNFSEPGRKHLTEEAIQMALHSLERGDVIAMKGLGGFHLCCDATFENTVEKLRQRKHREAKSLAVMFPSLESLRKECRVEDKEIELLTGMQRPIVLLNRLEASRLPGSLSPDNQLIGAMLPYTPLHHIITARFGKPLVMTSGNYSEEPIAIGNREAINRLCDIADGVLLHNRDIATRYDDSLVRIIAQKAVHLRRARGYAPAPIVLPFRTKGTVLAVGGHLKNTFCLLSGNRAYMSQHIGDMERLETLEHFTSALERFCKTFELTPEIIACDSHPDYLSTGLVEKWISKKQQAPFDTGNVKEVVAIQHHFAHAISCMVSNDFHGSALAVTFDGLGYGSDGTLWGGEVLLCTYDGFERVAHINHVPMPGGEKAVREPWRMALSWMEFAGIPQEVVNDKLRELLVDEEQIKIARQQLERKLNCPITSSCGRLFDGVAAMLGICQRSLYEGQAAIKLETAAWAARAHDTENEFCCEELQKRAEQLKEYQFELNKEVAPAVVDFSKTILSIQEDLNAGQPTDLIALRFHWTIARGVETACIEMSKRFKVDTVCLTGGVFQNALLTAMVRSLLERAGLKVLTHGMVPPNDGGISLGQAVAAAAQLGLLEHN